MTGAAGANPGGSAPAGGVDSGANAGREASVAPARDAAPVADALPTADPVPSKDYARQYRALVAELLPELERVLLEEDPVLGPSVAAFESEFAVYVRARHAVGVNSGTDALVLALRGLGVGAGDEVITAANTFVATVHAIRQVGARPVLVDPDPRTMLLDADAAAAAIGPHTRALLPVHLYGRACDGPAFRALAAARDLHLIEDVAQAHGARCADGTPAGSGASAGCFSFHPSKNLGAFGDGGCVTTDSAELTASLERLRNLGKRGKYEVHDVAPNSKLDTLQAAILRVKLRHLEGWIERRGDHAARYAEALADIDELTLPEPGPGRHAWHLYVVRTPRRDELRSWLASRGVKAGLHYPIPPHLQPAHADLGYARGALPVAEALADQVLSLPVSHELEGREIQRVCDALRQFHAL
ncbi:DegT/DnrJ/EryC1/StrS family aminotransferase [Engelhardtia mirabilis]|uniref:Aminotransferase n=1 Tax=Engelhardtia mirabilis TaxID=2528011 RepID=A0A518BF88_9BACT|nr:Aminotransferase [Planctomycetes bacterium Pla133]QDU99973.1 Aminotransferase [Planctomycetes bacterium Pla86]